MLRISSVLFDKKAFAHIYSNGGLVRPVNEVDNIGVQAYIVPCCTTPSQLPCDPLFAPLCNKLASPL